MGLAKFRIFLDGLAVLDGRIRILARFGELVPFGDVALLRGTSRQSEEAGNDTTNRQNPLHWSGLLSRHQQYVGRQREGPPCKEQNHLRTERSYRQVL